MIMTYDLFGHEKYRYTFRAECGEVPGCTLKDGATRIFLNTKGKNGDEVPAELVNFLRYMENSTEEVARASESERIMRIHERVCKVKKSEEAGLRYMQAWEEKYYEREEGREEGLREGLRRGMECGRQAGERKGLIEAYRELGMTKEEVIEKVAQEFGLSAEEAARETEKYWE